MTATQLNSILFKNSSRKAKRSLVTVYLVALSC